MVYFSTLFNFRRAFNEYNFILIKLYFLAKLYLKRILQEPSSYMHTIILDNTVKDKMKCMVRKSEMNN